MHSKPRKLTSTGILAVLKTSRYLVANSTIKQESADTSTKYASLELKITQMITSQKPGCEVETIRDKNENRIPRMILHVRLKHKQHGIICRPVIHKVTYLERGPGNDFFKNIYYIKQKKFVVAYEAFYKAKRRGSC